MVLFGGPGISGRLATRYVCWGPRLCLFVVFNFDLFVSSDGSLAGLGIIIGTRWPAECLYHVSKLDPRCSLLAVPGRWF